MTETIYEVPEELYDELVAKKAPVKISEDVVTYGQNRNLPSVTVQLGNSVSFVRDGAEFMSVLDVVDWLVYYPYIRDVVLRFVLESKDKVEIVEHIMKILYSMRLYPLCTEVVPHFDLKDTCPDTFYGLRWFNILLTLKHDIRSDLDDRGVWGLAYVVKSYSHSLKCQHIFMLDDAEALETLNEVLIVLDKLGSEPFACDSVAYIYLPQLTDNELYMLAKVVRSCRTKFREVHVEFLRR